MKDEILDLKEVESVEEFEQHIKAGIKIFLLTAPWCQPGRLQEEEIRKVAEKFEEKITVRLINVDKLQDIPIKYQISSFPTTMIFKGDVVEDQLVGVVKESTVSTKVEALF